MSHDASVEQQILATIDKWVEQELRPIAREFDQADEYPSNLVEQMKELGLFGATISEEYGGLGLSASTYARIVSRICEVWMAPSGIFNSHLIMASCVERPARRRKRSTSCPSSPPVNCAAVLASPSPMRGQTCRAFVWSRKKTVMTMR